MGTVLNRKAWGTIVCSVEALNKSYAFIWLDAEAVKFKQRGDERDTDSYRKSDVTDTRSWSRNKNITYSLSVRKLCACHFSSFLRRSRSKSAAASWWSAPRNHLERQTDRAEFSMRKKSQSIGLMAMFLLLIEIDTAMLQSRYI